MQLISVLQQASICVWDVEPNFITLTESWLKFGWVGVKKKLKEISGTQPIYKLEPTDGGDQILETPKFVSKAVSWKVGVSR